MRRISNKAVKNRGDIDTQRKLNTEKVRHRERERQKKRKNNFKL